MSPKMHKKEKEYLDKVISEFSLDILTAKKIIEVIKIRNRVD